MPILIALLVFVVISVAVFTGISLYDERKAQARILRDRLSATQKPAEQSLPDAAFLRDEVLSRIPAFDTWLRRSERVSVLQKMLAQGNVDVRAGNFLILCAGSAAILAIVAVVAGGNLLFGWVGRVCSVFSFPTPTPRTVAPGASPNLKKNFPRPSTPWPAPSAPDTPSPLRSR
jgi:Flp pilus assembly protein TadB